MPIYLYWGEDGFALSNAVKTLQQKTLDPTWESFNFDKISSEHSDAVMQALNQAMTPPFGAGDRFVWLVDTTLTQRCSEELLRDLDRTLPVLPETTTLLLTSATKPDGRLKSTKLLQKHAQIQEFSPIPPWKTELLTRQVERVAQETGVKLTASAVGYIVEAVGNNTRQLYSELEKIRVFAGDTNTALAVDAIAPLITASAQNSLKLVAAIRQGNTASALELVADLVRQNEPALKIVSTLVGQFRLRLWIKLMQETGERDELVIAKAAELNNPKQLYFLQRELSGISVRQLQRSLPILLDLEFALKRSADETLVLQTKVIELCHVFRRPK
ncbi:DNA polymerase III subunit delta [Myxacorys almedinensis]|uniref:DNA polymerase III subunit delta n=1 Tax=Myxacorys almedinensis A TaxID=2690445 RepID=A0A8J7YXX3_9CYAN|nr:DNA polymerase III subunit delta [Myxacorys almedinensis]NDJ16149.1 DNA polymerase III subunit delta [Myxacorys almedinensis A]